MVHLLYIVQISLAILLTVLILVQRANTDASGAFGADGGNQASLKKRGGELMLHRLTVTSAVLFALALAIPLIISR